MSVHENERKDCFKTLSPITLELLHMQMKCFENGIQNFIQQCRRKGNIKSFEKHNLQNKRQ